MINTVLMKIAAMDCRRFRQTFIKVQLFILIPFRILDGFKILITAKWIN